MPIIITITITQNDKDAHGNYPTVMEVVGEQDRNKPLTEAEMDTANKVFDIIKEESKTFASDGLPVIVIERDE